MPAKLIHKAPCPQSTFTPKPAGWWRTCACPQDWPKYEDDLLAEADEAIQCEQPRLLLTLTLDDGTLRQEALPWRQALARLFEVRGTVFRDSVKIEPDFCALCGDPGELTVAGELPNTLLRVCTEHIDDYRRPA